MASTTLPQEQTRPETAGTLLTQNVPVARPAQTAGALREEMTGRPYDLASHIAVCDDLGRLVGMARIEDVLAADGARTLADLMAADPPAVAPGTDQELVALKAAEHDASALAVVDGNGRFLGMVPPARLLGVLLHEHAEDIARMSGVLRLAAAARTVSEESVRRRLWHRLPWLLVGLIGAAFAADVVALFEGQLEETVLLAFFIPGIVYLADAVGTQTEALIIRGLSVGVGIRAVLARELLTGGLVGIVLATAFFPIGVWRWGDMEVTIVVSLSIAAACSTATVVAMALPWAFDALGRDPAFGSGPLATVAQDLLSIIIYFSIASIVL